MEVMTMKNPIGFLTANSAAVRVSTDPAENFHCQWAAFPLGHCKRSSAQQFRNRIKGFPVNDGRMALGYEILLLFPTVHHLLEWQGVGGILFLKQRIPHIPFIAQNVGDRFMPPLGISFPRLHSEGGDILDRKSVV